MNVNNNNGSFTAVRYIVPKTEPKPIATAESTCLDNKEGEEHVAATNGNNEEKTDNGSDGPAQKKQRLSNREYKKLKRGQNKVKLHRK